MRRRNRNSDAMARTAGSLSPRLLLGNVIDEVIPVASYILQIMIHDNKKMSSNTVSTDFNTESVWDARRRWPWHGRCRCLHGHAMISVANQVA
jgi:hypothetical protein